MTDELAIPTPQPTEFALDVYADLLKNDAECSNMIKFWTQQRDLVRAQLKELMGVNEVGTVNGQEVFFYQYQDRFNTAEFKKQYPNLYRAYMHTVTKEEVDVEMLKQSRPDIYRQFQVRAVRNVFEPPGGKPTP